MFGSAELIGICNIIINELLTAKKEDEQQLLCEEYADCLRTLVKTCGLPITDLNVLKPGVLAAMDKTDSPSLTNKARFGLMDIMELV